MPSTFPCSSVVREWLSKKTQTGRKKQQQTIIILSDWRRIHQMYVKLQTIPIVSIFSQQLFSVMQVMGIWELHGPLALIDVSAKVLFDIDRRVREGDLLLNDEKFTAKLSEGDSRTTEAKYHANCLCNFYSELKTIEKQNKDYYENCITYSIVWSEVVNPIKKTLKTSQSASASTLSCLKQMLLKAYQC